MRLLEKQIALIRDLNNSIAEGWIFFGDAGEYNNVHMLKENMRNFGHDPNDLIVLSVTPDGDGTIIGRFIKNDGSIYRFDFDLDDVSYSRISKIDPKTPSGRGHDLHNLEAIEEIAGRYLLNERHRSSI
ncbi:MAG: hypothetical protein AB7O49_20785 [Sphingomonadales bacterium]